MIVTKDTLDTFDTIKISRDEDSNTYKVILFNNEKMIHVTFFDIKEIVLEKYKNEFDIKLLNSHDFFLRCEIQDFILGIEGKTFILEQEGCYKLKNEGIFLYITEEDKLFKLKEIIYSNNKNENSNRGFVGD